jgi:fucose permease
MEAVDLRKKKRLVTIAFFIISGIVTASWASRIPDMQQRLGLNNAAWGSVLFAAPAGLFCGLQVASWLIGRIGVQKTMISSSVASTALLVLAGFCSFRFQLMTILFLLGFSRTILNISANTRSVEVQRLYDKPIISTFHGLWSLSCFASAALGTLMIINNIEPAQHFLIVGIIIIALVTLFRKNPDPTPHQVPEKRPFFVKPDRDLALLGCIAFCGMISENCMFDWSVNYFEKVVKTNKDAVTTGYTCFILSMTSGRLIGDRIVGRYGPVRVLQINGVLIAAGFLIAVFLPYLVTAALGLILIGLGMSIVVPVVYSLAAKNKHLSPSYAISAVTMIGYLGFLTGPILIGSVSDWIGMRWAFAAISVFGLLISVLAFKIPEEK